MSLSAKEMIARAKTLVIKVGSSILTGEKGTKFREDWMVSLSEDIFKIRKNGDGGDRRLLLVSSGAIALGRRALSLGARSLKLDEAQAAAAAGQIHLSRLWHEIFDRHGVKVAQILLTPDDTENRRRYLNARATLQRLMAWGALPIINENDTVATQEIRYGDNDRLAARVAVMMEADCLLLLSSVEGFFSADPRISKDAELIDEIAEITGETEKAAGEAGDDLSRGGMKAKLLAAKIVMPAGCSMIVADGRVDHPITAILEGAPCTRFPSRASGAKARKRWIAGTLSPKGALHLDEGAAAALRQGRSLLPAGVRRVEGAFSRGDSVLIVGEKGQEIGRGLADYPSEEAARIAGHKSDAFRAILNYDGPDEMIHRDNLVLTEDGKIKERMG